MHDWDRGIKDEVDANKFSIFKIEDDEDASGDEEEEVQDDKTEYSGVYVGPGNNGQLIKDYFEESEDHYFFTEKEKHNECYYLKWVRRHSDVNFYNFKKGKQLVNHIPNSLMVYGKRASLMTILEDKKEEIQM